MSNMFGWQILTGDVSFIKNYKIFMIFDIIVNINIDFFVNVVEKF